MLEFDTVFHLTRTAWDHGDLAGGRFACDRLRSMPEANPGIVEDARRNSCFYTVSFGSFARDFVAHRIDAGAEGAIDAPTLAHDGDGLLALARIGTGDGVRWRWIALDARGAPRGDSGEVAGAWQPEGWDLAGVQALCGGGEVTLSGVAVPRDGVLPRLAIGSLEAGARAFGAARL
ncbi:MAG: hypothetical protein ACKOWF_11350, partial [Chloroflexota bacterium]